MSRRGLFIVIEGADGAGKTTLARRLARHYRAIKRTVRFVREPGGTRLSERVRRILLDPEASMGARTELFLYLAARAQLVDEVIRPAIMRGEIVIADRFSLSTLAYQSAGRGLPRHSVRDAERFARDGLNPDLTIVLTVTAAEASRRRHTMRRRPDRIERESDRFFRAVRAFYDRLESRSPRLLVIDSSVGAAEVYRQAVAAIDRRLARR